MRNKGSHTEMGSYSWVLAIIAKKTDNQINNYE